MPTYTYETIPDAANTATRRFDVRQHFDDPPLTTDPETGARVRRVISGGLGPMTRSEHATPETRPGCGPENCGCGRFN